MQIVSVHNWELLCLCFAFEIGESRINQKPIDEPLTIRKELPSLGLHNNNNNNVHQMFLLCFVALPANEQSQARKNRSERYSNNNNNNNGEKTQSDEQNCQEQRVSGAVITRLTTHIAISLSRFDLHSPGSTLR